MCNDKKSACGELAEENVESDVKSCDAKNWHSKVSVSDSTSGIRSIEITSPGSRSISKMENTLIQYPEDIGSTEEVDVWVETSCCFHGVEITANDVSGKIMKCVAGINPNKSNSRLTWSSILSIFCAFMYYYTLEVDILLRITVLPARFLNQ